MSAQAFQRPLSGGLAGIRVKNAALVTLFKDPKYQAAIEHTEEYKDALQKNQINMNRMDEKYSHLLNEPQIQETVQGIQKDLDDYELIVQKCVETNKLMRFLTQTRLRRPFDKLNNSILLRMSTLEHKLSELDKEHKAKGSVESNNTTITNINNSNSNISVNNNNNNNSKMPLRDTRSSSEESLQNLSGSTGWKRSSKPSSNLEVCEIGCNQIFQFQSALTWPDFLKRLQSFETLTADDEEYLRIVLDNSCTQSVSRFKFKEFLKGFGPLGSSAKNLKQVLTEDWFHSYLTLEEAKHLLTGQPLGSWLMRFSSSKPGSFALDYMSKASVSVTPQSRYGVMIINNDDTEDTTAQHVSVIIETTSQGFSIKEESKELCFNTIYEIIDHYSNSLKYPFSGSLSKQSWFYGDLSSEEASICLAREKPGTFLVRFANNNPGCFAVTFVSTTGVLGKSLLKKVHGGFIVDHSPDTNVYSSVQALVSAYHQKRFFLYPYAYERPDTTPPANIGDYREATDVIEENERGKQDNNNLHISSNNNTLHSSSNNARSSMMANNSQDKSPMRVASTSNPAMPSKTDFDPPVIDWSIETVGKWVGNIFPQYSKDFQQKEINGMALLELNESDLRDELGIVVLGHRKIIMKKLNELPRG